MPSPVMRIAPKPSRLTVRSPPNLKMELVARLDVVDEPAPKIAPDPPANSVAPLARLIPRNVRRVTPLSTRFSFAPEELLFMLSSDFQFRAVNAFEQSYPVSSSLPFANAYSESSVRDRDRKGVTFEILVSYFFNL